MGFGSDKTGFYKPSAVTVTATGNPLTLQNAKRLRKLTIYGNAVQDGTPSPDAPLDVQLCGDKTGNLLDVSNFPSGPNGYVENGSIYVTGYIYQPGITPEDFLEMTGLQVGDEITTTANYKRLVTPSGSNGAEYIIFLRKQGNGEFLPLFRHNTVLNWTVPTDFNSSNYYAMYIYGGSTQTDDGSPRSVWSNLAIYKGSYTADTLPAYEPYGYKVSGRTEGLNLLDTNDILNDSGYVNSSYDNAIEIKPFHVVEGNKYVLITKGEKLVNDYSTIYFGKDDLDYFDKRTIVLSTGILKYSFADNTEVRYVITSSETCEITRCMIHGKDNHKNAYTVEEFGLYEYTDDYRSMPYEPYQPPQDFAVYLPEQIAKVGDVADEVVVDMDKQTAELKKNVGSVVADGEENWFRGGNQYDTADYTNRYSSFYDIRGNLETPGYFSNRFERKLGGIWNNPNSEAFNINNNQLHLSISNTRLGITADDESADRTTKFKAWLNDNNVTVYAPLATPVTTDITSLQQWDAMPQVSGTVTLTLSAEVEPSGAEAVYTATKRPKAQAHGAYAVR